ncbi:hypothetical protein B0A52_00710 [Exophiala mesophila]|uniref:Uncharacterized protein n=1 Tax=Exophiala mesophila TaxID=212818 RepID=A0A438NHZ7_EXOME|nr:hypothetical protein B0A52_00710 [Exophiala mesophila]
MINTQAQTSERSFKGPDSASISSGRARRLLRTIQFTRSKSLRQLMIEDKKRLERMRTYQAAKAQKAREDAASRSRVRTQRADQARAKKHREQRKKLIAEEKRNKKKWSGILRGFDPNAGLVRMSSRVGGHHLRRPDNPLKANSGGHASYASNESLSAILNPKLGVGQTWGIECGRPGGNVQNGKLPVD